MLSEIKKTQKGSYVNSFKQGLSSSAPAWELLLHSAI